MKTIEQASVEYSKEQYDHDPIMRFQCETHFEAGIDFAQRWISIEEELPEIGEKVITKMAKDKRTSYGIVPALLVII